MSRHEGVSCDSCLKAGFRGRRYKCLICYDYDLCSTCYEAGATTTRHTTDHPVQCILTRTDFDIFYGGEALTAEQPQSFSCPYCGEMGFSESSLQDHVTSQHKDSSNEVVCPICAALPGGDPNHVTDDFAGHLTLEHRTPREFDEPIGIRHVRRIPHRGRGVGGTRTRHVNMHFSSGGSNLTGLSPSGGREQMDPIAELLSQLSSVRNRAAAAQSVSSQLQQLEMQLQSTSVHELEIERGRRLLIKRQQLEKLPKRQQAEVVKSSLTANATSNASGSDVPGGSASSTSNSSTSQFLLSRCVNPQLEAEQNVEQERVDRSVFVQELLLSTLTEQLQIASTDKSSSSETVDFQAEVIGPSVSEGSESSHKEASDQSSSNNLQSIPKQKKVEKPQSLQKPAPAGNSGASASSGRPNTVQVSSVRSVQGAAPIVYPVQHMGGLSPLSSMGGAGPTVGNHHSITPGRPMSAGRERERDRDTRVPPPQAKRNMLKHMPATKASDREPPPH